MKANIVNPEYATSRERISALRQVVTDGKEAEIVLKYAEKYLELVKESVLRTLSNPSGNAQRAAVVLQVANQFVGMIKNDAERAKRKEKTLEELEENK